MMNLISVAKLIMGQSPPSSSYNDEGKGLPFYQGKTDFGFIYPTPRKYCTDPKKVAEVGDILISVRAPVGPVNIANSKSCIGRGIAAIRAIKIDPSFLYFDLIFQEAAIASLGTGSTFKAINKSQLENVKIPEFPLPEQRKIAYVLGTVQKAIEKQDRLIKTITELKKTLMQKLFNEGLLEFRRKARLHGELQKETEIGLVPESWEVKPLIETVEYIDYGLSKAIPKNPPPNGIRIVSTADITREGELLYWKIRKTEAPEKTIDRLTLNNGDLLFNWRNSPELIGKSTIYNEQQEPHIFASFILRICCGEKKSHNYYLKHLMNFWREKGVFVQLSRRAVNQANYNRNEISVLKIPVPSYAEQVEIANTIGKIESKIEHHQSKKQALTDMFKTLLQELMTGQRRVHELEFWGMDREYKQKEQPLSMAAEE